MYGRPPFLRTARRLADTARALALCVLVQAVWLAGCQGVPGRQANFERCLSGERACREADLTPEELARLAEWHRRRHLEDCLAQGRCNEALLSPVERARVHAVARQANLDACLRGEAACRVEFLDDDQKAVARDAALARNVDHCLAGIALCDTSLLTAAQRDAVRQAYLDRNFTGCMNAVGTLVACNREDLTPQQRALVDRRDIAVNRYVCANALMGCDESLLAADQGPAVAAEGANPR